MSFVNGSAFTDDNNAGSIVADAIQTFEDNAVVVFISAYSLGSPVTVTNVTDTAGNTYEFLVAGGGDANHRMEAWVAYGISANASNAVTATFSAGVGFRKIVVGQYSDVDSLEDSTSVTLTAPGGAALHTTDSLDVAGAAQLVGGWVSWDSPSTFSSAGDTTLRVVSGDLIALGDVTAASGGTYALELASSASNSRYAMFGLAFGVGGGGGSTRARKRILRSGMNALRAGF
jgi:hypothetical protein